MDETFSPCPFCGKRNLQVVEVDSDGWAAVCATCGGIGPVGTNEEEARRRWNLRPVPPPESPGPGATAGR